MVLLPSDSDRLVDLASQVIQLQLHANAAQAFLGDLTTDPAWPAGGTLGERAQGNKRSKARSKERMSLGQSHPSQEGNAQPRRRQWSTRRGRTASNGIDSRHTSAGHGRRRQQNQLPVSPIPEEMHFDPVKPLRDGIIQMKMGSRYRVCLRWVFLYTPHTRTSPHTQTSTKEHKGARTQESTSKHKQNKQTSPGP